MNIKPPNNQPVLLKCPHCNSNIKTPKTDEWSPCSHCHEMVKKQQNKQGVWFLEAGTRTETIRPIQFKDSEQKKQPRIIQTMPLHQVIEYKIKAKNKLSTIKADKEIIGKKINEHIKKDLSTKDLNDQLGQLDNQTEEFKAIFEQLNLMEEILRNERRDAIKRADTSGSVFIWSFIIIFVDLLIFSWIASVPWNWKTILGAIIMMFITSSILASVAALKNE